ncbi:Rpn family recombination-promoting nuclease/putative transposase [Pontibacter sp. G13]|uniref:Rpn family recombination-promoting nuclease/putative transposase n=1 Tax=Pontibacter sp. G13 TaxID=3074898 RepID=UPI00288B1A6F|nr:Rpn family recombination-promoting nuclease/putative transposase [Pontibacter sp. G13]WNJ17529.1 Rpn family recombination-promoting nuclease/putative transposase [Pontibacter sp. G13]
MKHRFIHLLTDFGFKKIFSSDQNSDLLVHFLNALLPGIQPSKEVFLGPQEQQSFGPKDRKAVFDLHCTNEEGVRMIVEVQQAFQAHFKKRAVFYMIFPILDQAKPGKDWDFNFRPVRIMSLLDFEIENLVSDAYYHQVMFQNINTNSVYLEDVLIVHVELPKFRKNLHELESDLDHWLYLFRHLSSWEDVPEPFQKAPYMKLIREAELANLSKEDRAAYYRSLKYYRDFHNQMEYREKRGIKIGEERGEKRGEKRGIKIGEERGEKRGEKRGIKIGEERGIKIGEERGKEEGIKIGEERGKEELKQKMAIVLEEGFKEGFSLGSLQRITNAPIDHLAKTRESWLQKRTGWSSPIIQSS